MTLKQGEALIVVGIHHQVGAQLDQQRTAEHEGEAEHQQPERARRRRIHAAHLHEHATEQQDHRHADDQRPDPRPPQDRVGAIAARQQRIRSLTEPFVEAHDFVRRERETHEGERRHRAAPAAPQQDHERSEQRAGDEPLDGGVPCRQGMFTVEVERTAHDGVRAADPVIHRGRNDQHDVANHQGCDPRWRAQEAGHSIGSSDHRSTGNVSHGCNVPVVAAGAAAYDARHGAPGSEHPVVPAARLTAPAIHRRAVGRCTSMGPAVVLTLDARAFMTPSAPGRSMTFMTRRRLGAAPEPVRRPRP